MVFDSELALVHPPKQYGSEVDIPESVADFVEANELARQRVGHADPGTLYGQRGEPAERRGREGDAVIRADDSRQSVLME